MKLQKLRHCQRFLEVFHKKTSEKVLSEKDDTETNTFQLFQQVPDPVKHPHPQLGERMGLVILWGMQPGKWANGREKMGKS